MFHLKTGNNLQKFKIKKYRDQILMIHKPYRLDVYVFNVDTMRDYNPVA